MIFKYFPKENATEIQQQTKTSLPVNTVVHLYFRLKASISSQHHHSAWSRLFQTEHCGIELQILTAQGCSIMLSHHFLQQYNFVEIKIIDLYEIKLTIKVGNLSLASTSLTQLNQYSSCSLPECSVGQQHYPLFVVYSRVLPLGIWGRRSKDRGLLHLRAGHDRDPWASRDLNW